MSAQPTHSHSDPAVTVDTDGWITPVEAMMVEVDASAADMPQVEEREAPLGDHAQPAQSGQPLNDWVRKQLFEDLVRYPDGWEHFRNFYVSQGFDEAALVAEREQIQSHPYFRSAKSIHRAWMKERWYLHMYDRLKNHDPRCRQIERRKYPTRDEFFRDYYSVNRPAIFTNAIDRWPALKLWTPEYFKDKVGDVSIQVQVDREKNARYEREMQNHAKAMTMAEYVDKVLAGPSNDFYMTAYNSAYHNNALAPLFDDVANIGDDWMNMDMMRQCGFIWLGPEGTITPLHHDITNNILIQIYGRKRFKMIPSCQVPYLYNDDGVYTEVDPLQVDTVRFPEFQNATVLEFDLHPGETLFIPVGWWHHVVGLDTSISFSCTNFIVDNHYIDIFVH